MRGAMSADEDWSVAAMVRASSAQSAMGALGNMAVSGLLAVVPLCTLLLSFYLLSKLRKISRALSPSICFDGHCSAAPAAAKAAREEEAPARLCMEERDGLVCLRWPETCQGEDFTHDSHLVAKALAAKTTPFGLVHDLRYCAVLTIRLDDVVADAAAIASNGKVERVAFVLACSPWIRATISAGLGLFCPVQPAAIFDDAEEACEWATLERTPAGHVQKKM